STSSRSSRASISIFHRLPAVQYGSRQSASIDRQVSITVRGAFDITVLLLFANSCRRRPMVGVGGGWAVGRRRSGRSRGRRRRGTADEPVRTSAYVSGIAGSFRRIQFRAKYQGHAGFLTLAIEQGEGAAHAASAFASSSVVTPSRSATKSS